MKVRVVADAGFDRSLLPQLRDAAKMWQSADLKLDVQKRPVGDCGRDASQQNTICVSSTNLPEACRAQGGCSWFGPLTPLPDGMSLMSYGRLWINPIYVSPGDPDWTRHVFCHELGHNIGLGHTEDGPGATVPSCMSNDFRYYSVGPSKDDLAYLHALYSTVAP